MQITVAHASPLWTADVIATVLLIMVSISYTGYQLGCRLPHRSYVWVIGLVCILMLVGITLQLLTRSPSTSGFLWVLHWQLVFVFFGNLASSE